MNDSSQPQTDVLAARLREAPLSPRSAAELVEKLARAAESEHGQKTEVIRLGALLYESVAGQPPFRDPTAPELPIPLRKQRRDTPRELEAICMKCLRKAPEERYASAVHLADDLRRYLEGRPTIARPISRWERMTNWARRRPVVAAFLAVLIAAMVSLAVAGWWIHQGEAIKEARQQQLLRQKTLEAEARLLNTAAESYVETNDAGRAESAAREALSLYRRLAAAGPRNLRYQVGLATSYERLGDALHAKDASAEALSAYQEAETILRRLVEHRPRDGELQHALSGVLLRIGDIHRAGDDPLKAAKAYEQALSLSEQAAASPSVPVERQRRLALSHERTADLLLEGADAEFPDAAALDRYRTALAIYEDLLRRAPSYVQLRDDVARVKKAIEAVASQR